MTDQVTLAIVGAVVTLGTALITGFFATWKFSMQLKKEVKNISVAAKKVDVKVNKNAVDIEEVAAKTKEVHEAVSQLDAFNKETKLGREEAAARYAKQLEENLKRE